MPLIARIAAEHDVLVSVDTYKPEVAEAAIAAGAAIVNDVSGLRDPRARRRVRAHRRGAGAHAHARGAEGHAARPRRLRRRRRPTCVGFLRERMARRAGARAWRRSRSCSTRARTSPRRRRRRSRCCGGSTLLRALGRPLLLAVSRKDFLGAITGRGAARARRGRRSPRSATASTRARAILRVHDVAAAADFLAVRAVLRGERELAPDEGLTPDRYPEPLAC